MKTSLKISIAFFLILIIMLYATPIVENDGYTYFALTRSLVIDGDFDIVNDPVNHSPNLLRLRETGKLGKRPIFSGGYALAYSPFFKLAPYIPYFHILPANMTGYKSQIPRSEAVCILIASIFFGLGSLLAIYRLLHERFNPGISALSALLVFIGTPLMYYTLNAPSFTHALDAFWFAWSLRFLDKSRDESYKAHHFIFLAGVLAGLGFTVRNVNAVVVLFLFFGSFIKLKTVLKGTGSRWFSAFLFLCGVVPFILFQLFYNLKQYGHFFDWGYSKSGVFAFDSHLIPMLFSLRRGLFIWSPVTIISIFGLFVLFKRDRWLTYMSLGCIAAFFGLSQFFPHWWGGTSFGLRFATFLAPVFALGICELIHRARYIFGTICIIFCVFTFLLCNGFILLHHSQHGLSQLESTGGKYTATDVLNFSVQHIRTGHLYRPIRFILGELASGYSPAIIPNLIESFSKPTTVFVTGFSANFNRTLDDSMNLQGKLHLYSRKPSEGVFSFLIWPEINTRLIKYPRRDLMGIHEVKLKIPSGRSQIDWSLNHTGMMTLIVPGYDSDVYAPRLHWKPTFTTLNSAHIEAGIFSPEPRILNADITR